MSTPVEPALPGSRSPDDHWWGRPLAETRWPLELAHLLSDDLYRHAAGVPRGDGRPVVLAPGFGAGDQTLAVLANWLMRLGYEPSTCGFVANVDCSDRALERVGRRVEVLHRRHGRRVAVVGHSRGGHFARALGAGRPERVSHAVSLGAVLRGQFGASVPTLYAVAATRRVLLTTGRARSADCVTSCCRCPFSRGFGKPLPLEPRAAHQHLESLPGSGSKRQPFLDMPRRADGAVQPDAGGRPRPRSRHDVLGDGRRGDENDEARSARYSRGAAEGCCIHCQMGGSRSRRLST
jgi:triacylglycerol lipase